MEEGHTAERLKELQALPLERKIGFTAARITEAYNRWGGRCYISFSGGKDSTVLLHIARTLFPDIKAVFIDTGLQYPQTKEFVKTFDNVDIIRPKKSFLQVIQKYGYPVHSKQVSKLVHEYRSAQRNGTVGWAHNRLGCNGQCPTMFNRSRHKYLTEAPFKISHKCCDVMKKDTAHRYQKESQLYPIVGTLASQSLLRLSNWLQHGCNAFDNTKHPISKPLSFWTEQDILQYIKLHDLPVSPIYGELIQDEQGKLKFTQLDRTGCVFCMFGLQSENEPNRFQRLKQTHPKLWDYCINGALNMKPVLQWLKIPYE